MSGMINLTMFVGVKTGVVGRVQLSLNVNGIPGVETRLPLLFSEALNLHPVAIIVAILVFGGLWGFWGIFFAIPLATVVAAVLKAWPRVSNNEDPSEQASVELETDTV